MTYFSFEGWKTDGVFLKSSICIVKLLINLSLFFVKTLVFLVYSSLQKRENHVSITKLILHGTNLLEKIILQKHYNIQEEKKYLPLQQKKFPRNKEVGIKMMKRRENLIFLCNEIFLRIFFVIFTKCRGGSNRSFFFFLFS